MNSSTPRFFEPLFCAPESSPRLAEKVERWNFAATLILFQEDDPSIVFQKQFFGNLSEVKTSTSIPNKMPTELEEVA